jgi:ATP-dependent Clp protease ATP-binding subunit ClpC
MTEKKYDIKNSEIFDNDNNDEQSSSNDKGKNLSNKNTNKSNTPMLDKFGRDITKLAYENKIDPVIGRDKEIQRVSQILSRRKKNNPILVGEPGCVDGNTKITIKKISDDIGHETINI